MSSHTSSAAPPALNCSCWNCVYARRETAKKARDLIVFAKSGGPIVDGLRAREAAFNEDVLPPGTTVLPPRELYGKDMWPRAVPRMQAQKPWSKRPESLNDFAQSVHADNQHWWHDPSTGEKLDRNMGELLMLVVSEIAECMEGERKDLMDDHLPHRKMAEVELADAVIRIADIAGAKGYNIEGHSTYVSTPENKGHALMRICRAVLKVTTYISNKQRGGYLGFAVSQIEAYAQKHGYDLWGAVVEKREYNRHRADHKPEARLAAGGKKF